jgi:GNAT superfamily N-acetyltransferase
MQPITDSAQLFDAIQRVRQGSSGFTTTFFASREQAQAWIDRTALSYASHDHALLIFRRDRDFHHLYHVAADAKALTAALASLPSPDVAAEPGAALTADLVGREADVRALAELYRRAGFAQYTSLFRMVRLADPAAVDDYEDPQVVFAGPADAPAILAFLERLLDRFAEQTPDLDEIDQAIAKQNIIIVRRGSELGGLLFFETTGQTSILRYWFVDDRHRNEGIGARLIKTFFRLCRGGKRIMLWVIADNSDAIAKYQHYGFRAESLVDQIMIRKRGA